MVLGVGLRNRKGHTLLGGGQVLNAEYIGRLKELGYCAVWIDDEDTRDIPYEDSLSDATRLATTAAIQDTFAMTMGETEKLRTVSVEDLRGALQDRRFQQAFHDNAVIERLTGNVDLVVSEVLDRAVLTGLGSLRTHSTYMYHHSLDVAVTATMIGRLIGYDSKTLSQLAVGCILHDIGSLFVDSEILDKPAVLSVDEYRRVKDHTSLGYLFIRDSLRVGLIAAHVAYQHHERQDGTGYPRGLTGSNRIVRGAEMHLPGRITPLGEIAAIADFHDACSSARPHRGRMGSDAVWSSLRAAGGAHLNREMVEAFLTVLPPYPLGTQVDVVEGPWAGYRAVVAMVHQDAMHRPSIRVLQNAAGERVTPVDVDLRREDGRIRSAVETPALATTA
ncbi:MAG TPA: HD domain-containing phosphohydrolase [Terriglobales bacterium]|nr:HD domain-containing phosphohydrolase [Terriglobales bacterium]